MKLRTFKGESVRAKMTTDSPVSPDGFPVLLVNDEPLSPEEAEFFLESATPKELEMLEEAGYDLPEWENEDEGYEEVEEIDTSKRIMSELPKTWDEIFKKQGKVFTEPHAAMPGLVRLLKSTRARTVLDFGSGSGRHVIYLAKAGLSVFGLDNSPKGIQFTKEWLEQEGFCANLLLGDMADKLPYPDSFFDAIIAVQVIHHARIAVIRLLIREMWRILKRGGVLFVTVPMSKNPKLTYEQIEPNTYMPLDGREQGLPHHYFTPKELCTEFYDFQIFGIHIDATRQYCLFGRK